MCFSLEWVKDMLIFLIIICGVIAFVRLFLPRLLALMGASGGLILAAINIIIWVAVACFIVYIFFDFIACLGGFHLPRMG